MQSIQVKSTDRPRVTTYFKIFVARRAVAFACGNHALLRNLRNRVNRVRTSLTKTNYCQTEMLTTGNPYHSRTTIKKNCVICKVKVLRTLMII
jgi:hypothetical protein